MVLKYKVVFTNEAFNDLEQIHSYIKDTLNNPKSADEIYIKLINKCFSLEVLPNRFSIYKNNQEIRFVNVINYLIFYCSDDRRNTVQILRIMYCKRNIKTILKKIK